MTSHIIIQACQRSVCSDAGSPPYAVYAAVTIATASIGTSGSIPARVSIALPMAVNSANRKVNM